MIRQLRCSKFKCLSSFDRKFSPLTLLTGYNAAGKSSAIQLLAMLKQTISSNEWSTSLQLNGASVSLGRMVDVIDRNSGGDGFSLGIVGDNWECDWRFEAKDRMRDSVAEIKRVELSIDGAIVAWTPFDRVFGGTPLRRLVPQPSVDATPFPESDSIADLSAICHIGSDRIGPQETYGDFDPQKFPDVGSRGEKTPQCLDQFADFEVSRSLVLEGIAPTVRSQVNGWMGMLFPGFQYNVTRIANTNLLTLGIRTVRNGEYFRPANVGYGLTHVLPIVAACVSARRGSILLIENPELHLHPGAQSMLGSFLALTASSGVQVIVETHSDHILNGVRRAVSDGRVECGDISTYFFSIEDTEDFPKNSVVEICMDERGGISGWPEGFFDQIETDLDFIHRE